MTRRALFAGFSLIELMVGMAISLLALFAIEKAVTIGLNSKRVTSESTDLDTAANMAIAQLESDLKSAGYGIVMDPFLGCNAQMLFSGSIRTVTLNPVTIGVGSGPGGSDTLTVNRSRGDTGFASSGVLVSKTANDTSDIKVSNRFNFSVNDYGMVADGAGNCGVFKVTALPSDGLSLTWSGPTGGFNFAIPTSGFVMNTGPNFLSSRTYSIDATTGNRLMRDEFLDTSAALPVSEQIVYLKAFYGKDPGGVMRVTSWDQTTPTTSADWKRVLAIRIALVARSNAYETESPTSSTLKLWPDELLADGTTVAGPTYTVSTTNRHYRHVVRSMIVPLRNNIWNNN